LPPPSAATKAEEHDHYIFTVLKHMHDPADLEFDDIDVFFGPDFLISVHRADSALIDTVRARAEQNTPTDLTGCST
jgi:Mg2+ and Co2+ transporter CorA